ncbi:MAG: hypothetical protein Q9207_006395 [Kuettlingeria erythrocarpa]
MIALNRKLDEIDDLLSPSFQAPDGPRIINHERQLNFGNKNDLDPFGLYNEQTVKYPSSSNWLETPELIMHANEQRFELLPQLDEAMEQLRQRQKETKLLVFKGGSRIGPKSIAGNIGDGGSATLTSR